MPFDQTSYERSIIAGLVQQADEALDACDRAMCVDLIEQIYGLLDAASAARVVDAFDRATDLSEA